MPGMELTAFWVAGRATTLRRMTRAEEVDAGPDAGAAPMTALNISAQAKYHVIRAITHDRQNLPAVAS